MINDNDFTDFMFSIIYIKRSVIEDEQKIRDIKKLIIESDDNLQYAAMTLMTCLVDDRRNENVH